jgi:hypothetical protein
MRAIPHSNPKASWFFFLVFMFALLSPVGAQTSTRRIALVIGNGDYAELPQLKNPANDAMDIAAVLKRLGFEIMPLYNATRKQMDNAISAFRESLSQDRRSQGFFYYAGHGVQSNGENYLIPIGADIRTEADLEDEAVNLQRVLGNIEDAGNLVNIIVLDACRNNPLPKKARSAERGLAVMSAAPPESIILFSTAANQIALDGDGRNSPFALALINHLADAGDITTTIKSVTAEVKNRTGGAQTPFQYSSLDTALSLNPQAGSGESSGSRPDEGTVVVSAKTAGALYLDGKKTSDVAADGTARLGPVDAGRHVLSIHYPTGNEENNPFSLSPGETANISFSYTVMRLPEKTMDVQGDLRQWDDVKPALIGTSLEMGNQYIDKIYLAIDSKNLYMRFDIKDDRKPTWLHPNNFNTSYRFASYGVSILYGDLVANVELSYSSGGGWQAHSYAFQRDSATDRHHELSSSTGFSMKGSTGVAAFPLGPIRQWFGDLGPGNIYRIAAYTWCNTSSDVRRGSNPDRISSTSAIF